MKLLLPKHLIDWIDANRGEHSRQSFIIKCMFKLKDLSDLKTL